LYRARLGWLLGGRFVQLTVRGRRTGLPRQVVLEVIGGSPAAGHLLVASGWGPRAQWFRNVTVNPHVQVQVARRRCTGEVVALSEADGAEALREYARAHHWAYQWFIGPLILGHRPSGTSDEFRRLARLVPILMVRAAA
jgi:deazaflavin-dependent oxidoreductase (nitroreductase family)